MARVNKPHIFVIAVITSLNEKISRQNALDHCKGALRHAPVQEQKSSAAPAASWYWDVIDDFFGGQFGPPDLHLFLAPGRWHGKQTAKLLILDTDTLRCGLDVQVKQSEDFTGISQGLPDGQGYGFGHTRYLPLFGVNGLQAAFDLGDRLGDGCLGGHFRTEPVFQPSHALVEGHSGGLHHQINGVASNDLALGIPNPIPVVLISGERNSSPRQEAGRKQAGHLVQRDVTELLGMILKHSDLLVALDQILA